MNKLIEMSKEYQEFLERVKIHTTISSNFSIRFMIYMKELFKSMEGAKEMYKLLGEGGLDGYKFMEKMIAEGDDLVQDVADIGRMASEDMGFIFGHVESLYREAAKNEKDT